MGFSCCLGGGRLLSVVSFSEEDRSLVFPMIRLLAGVFFFGLFFRKVFQFAFLLPRAFYKMSPLFLTIIGLFS